MFLLCKCFADGLLHTQVNNKGSDGFLFFYLFLFFSFLKTFSCENSLRDMHRLKICHQWKVHFVFLTLANSKCEEGKTVTTKFI